MTDEKPCSYCGYLPNKYGRHASSCPTYEIADLEKRLIELRDGLRSLEWCQDAGVMLGLYCPACNGQAPGTGIKPFQKEGHLPDCWLNALLMGPS